MDNSPTGEVHVASVIEVTHKSEGVVNDVGLSPAGDKGQSVLHAASKSVCGDGQLVNKAEGTVIDISMSPAGDIKSPAGGSLSLTAVGDMNECSSKAVVVDVFDTVPLCGRIPVCYVNVPSVTEPIVVYNDCLWGICSCDHYIGACQITVDPL